MGRDDLLMGEREAKRWLESAIADGHRLIAEEKIDGANLGFSLGDDLRVRAQNRSHYITSKSQEQVCEASALDSAGSGAHHL